MPPDRAVVVAVGPGEQVMAGDGSWIRRPILGGTDKPIQPGDVIYCEFGMSAPITGSDHLHLLPSPAILATAPGLTAIPVDDDSGEFLIEDRFGNQQESEEFSSIFPASRDLSSPEISF